MTAPFVWIVFPGLVALLLFVVQRWVRWTAIIGTGVTVGLALAAWRFPIGEAFTFGPWSLKLDPVQHVLGRRFALEDADRMLLALLFLLAAAWFGGTLLARPGHTFVPFGLGMIVLLVAALAVEPFLYSALFIQLAVLISIPMLLLPGDKVGRGVIRYLTFQTLGLPFILFTGWMLSESGGTPTDLDFAVRAAMLMGFGFALLLAVFPFHTWIPMLAEEAHPYVAAFIFLLLPGLVSLFGIGFLDQYAWLRNTPQTFNLLRVAGFLMVVTGGVWAAFQQHLARIMGFAALVEIGLSLLAIGLGEKVGVQIFFALFLPRSLGFLLWALALSVIRAQVGNLTFHRVRSVARRMPIVAVAGMLAHFSVAGFPLLAGFPVYLALWGQTASEYPLFAYGTLLGSAGLVVVGLRSLAILMLPPKADMPDYRETRLQQVVFLLGSLLLLGAGLFPQLFIPLLSQLPLAFDNLFP